MNQMLLSTLSSKFQLPTLLAEYPGLLQLGYLKDKRASELSIDDIGALGNAFGVSLPLTEEVQTALVAWFRGHNIDSVCDILQSPDSVVQVVQFIKGGLTAIGKPKPVANMTDLFIT